jgi:tetratricopeptide (TPR) repeat protein
MTRNYRAVNTEFNVLYNGELALEQGKKSLSQNTPEDFFEILPLERITIKEEIQLPGASKNTDFERAEEKSVKAIQKHAIYFDGKEHNPQIDEAYMMLGKARYFDSRFIPALEAFNFILFRYPTSNSINKAKIWREKTNIRLNNEDLALKNLKELFQKAKLEDEEFADASAMMAQAYINLESLDSAVVHIKNAAAYTKNNENKGRFLYIKGQLYNLLGKKDSANLAFDEVIALNRKSSRVYMINAKLEKAKNFDYEKGDKTALQEQLEKLAKDRENRPFLDIIYHQTGLYYRKMDSIKTSITYYNKSIKEFRQSKKLQALNYASLGDIYFDNSEYKKAGNYYDSTLKHLTINTKEYRQFKKKRDNLEEVIRYEDITKTNDSILGLVAMTEEQRLAYFTSYTTNLKKAAISDSIAAVKQKESFRSDEFFKGNKKGEENPTGSKFYFYNQTAVAFGKQEFRKQWGDRKLEDHWRRFNKNVQIDLNPKNTDSQSISTTTSIGDMFLPETYLARIPSNQKQIDSISNERDFAYYQLGLIYKEKFKEYNLAITRLEKLLTFPPEERLIAPAKYHLYKTYEIIGNNAMEQHYKKDIVTNHPESRYAAIINNPDAILSKDEASPEFKYFELYHLFETQKYEDVIALSDVYITGFTGDEMVPKFELLKATAIGKRDGFEAYKKALNFVSLNYPNSDEGKRAQQIYSQTLPLIEKFDFVQNETSERWKLVYEFDTAAGGDALTFQKKLNKAIEELNYSYLTTSLDYYTPDKVFVVVHGLYSKEGSKGFAEALKINKKYKVTRPYFEISSPNYAVVQVHKNLDLYNNKIE